MYHHRPHRPPPRPFPNPKAKTESASNLFSRVVSITNAKHAEQCALGAPQISSQPGSWRVYDPSPTPPASPSTPLHRLGSLMSAAEIVTPTASPYPPPVPIPPPADRIAGLVPWASGSTSQIFKTIIKRPQLVQMYLHDQLHTNAPDVENQFLAELRAYQTTGPHRNIAALLGCIDGLGMVLEQVEGDTLFDRVLKKNVTGTRWEGKAKEERTNSTLKVEWFNQLVEALCHVHAHGLSHGDINSLNVLITTPIAHPPNIVKLVDFGRSTFYAPPGCSSGPNSNLPPSEVPHPPAHPFAAPEVLRGGKYILGHRRVPVDGRLSDAYSFGVLLWCLDEERLVELDQAAQRKEEQVLFTVDYDGDDVDNASSGSGSSSSSSSGLNTPSSSPDNKGILDEGYFSGNNNGGGVTTGGTEDGALLDRRHSLTKTHHHQHHHHGPPPSPTATMILGGGGKRPRRLFSSLIKGYMKRWEERTPIQLSQRMQVPLLSTTEGGAIASTGAGAGAGLSSLPPPALST